MTVAVSWPTVPLAHVIVDTQYGTSEKANDDGIGLPMLRMGNITYGGGLDLTNLKYIELASCDLERYTVQRGDLLFNRTNSQELVGKMAVWQRDDHFAFAGYLVRLRVNPAIADPAFVSCWFNTPEMKTLLRTRAKPSINMSNINANEVLTFPIVLPPLPEQRRIAEVLDRAEALRSKRQAVIELLATATQSIFVEMFGDPVVNGMGWPLKKFSEIGTLDRGVSKHRPRNAPELLGGLHPLVQTGEVSNCDGYVRAHNNTYSDLGLQQSKMWPAGTLCITIAANIAKTGVLTFDACFPDSVVGFRANDQATVEYARIWLSFLQKMLEETAPESAQKNINLAILRDLDVPLPPISLRREFASRVAALERLKTSYRASLSEFDAFFSSLQHRAFQGTL